MQSDKDRLGEHGVTERSTASDEMVMLGRVSGVYGVKGWVKIYSYTDPMEAIVDYAPWYIRPGNAAGLPSSGWQAVRLKHGRRHAKTVVAQFEGCDDRNAAQGFIGYEIAIKPSQLARLDGEEEFYWRDLVGLHVVNQQGIALGSVTALMETGANDVLVVRSEDTGRECLIPWTPGDAIVSVRLDTSRLLVDWQADWCD